MLQINNNNLVPKLQEWAILNDQIKKDHETKLAIEKQRQKIRQIALKQALDQDVEQKRNRSLKQKQQNQRYTKYILEDLQKNKAQQQKKNLEKLIKRKEMEEKNRQLIESYERSTFINKPIQLQKTFEIGKGRDQENKRKKQMYRRNIVEILENQIKDKEKQKTDLKLTQLQKQERDKQYQKKLQEIRQQQLQKSKRNNKSLSVYKYFTDLQEEKKRKQQQMIENFVITPAIQKKIQEEQKLKMQLNQKQSKLAEIKDSLIQQIQKHNNQKLLNKQQLRKQDSYRSMDKIFQEKRMTYDKNQYYKFLKQQEEQHKRKKNMQKYMSPEQYMLNLNQLNKAVNSEYQNPYYTDRSLINIGNPEEMTKKKDEIYFKKVFQSPIPQDQSPKIQENNQKQKQDLYIIRKRIELMRSHNLV